MSFRMFVKKINDKLLQLQSILYWEKCYMETLYGNYDKTPYKEELEYLRKRGRLQKGNGLVFPYPFWEEYNKDVSEVRFDS